MKCPCIDCADRQSICHDTCVRFAEYRRPLDAAIAQRVQVQQAQLACGQTPADYLNCERAVCVWDKPPQLHNQPDDGQEAPGRNGSLA